jgi:hypothetical protein
MEYALGAFLKYGYPGSDEYEFYETPQEAYAAEIDTLYKRMWDKNPYVFAYSFKLIK